MSVYEMCVCVSGEGQLCDSEKNGIPVGNIFRGRTLESSIAARRLMQVGEREREQDRHG